MFLIGFLPLHRKLPPWARCLAQWGLFVEYQMTHLSHKYVLRTLPLRAEGHGEKDRGSPSLPVNLLQSLEDIYLLHHFIGMKTGPEK